MKSVKRSVMKKVRIFGKSIPVLAIVAIVMSAGMVGAMLVDYLSGTLTTTATVKSPITISGEIEHMSFPDMLLQTGGDGTAEWTTAEQYSGRYSIKFSLPNGETEGNNAEVEIPLSEPVTVGSVDDWTYWAKGDGILPAMKFYIDTTKNMEADVMVLAARPFFHSSPLPSGWSQISRSDYDGGAGIFPWYAAYNLVEDGWTKRGYGGNWSNVIGDYSECNLVKVAIGYTDLRGDPTSATAYIDDITISGKTYDLDPTIETQVLKEDTPATFTDVFCGGDTFSATLSAHNNANNPVTAPIAIIVEASDGTEWKDGLPEITAKLDGAELISKGVTSEGKYAVIIVGGTFDGGVVGDGSVVSPSGSVTFDLQFDLNPAIKPGTYTWKAIAVNLGTNLDDISILVP